VAESWRPAALENDHIAGIRRKNRPEPTDPRAHEQDGEISGHALDWVAVRHFNAGHLHVPVSWPLAAESAGNLFVANTTFIGEVSGRVRDAS
jgi:hypothetical protein